MKYYRIKHDEYVYHDRNSYIFTQGQLLTEKELEKDYPFLPIDLLEQAEINRNKTVIVPHVNTRFEFIRQLPPREKLSMYKGIKKYLLNNGVLSVENIENALDEKVSTVNAILEEMEV